MNKPKTKAEMVREFAKKSGIPVVELKMSDTTGMAEVVRSGAKVVPKKPKPKYKVGDKVCVDRNGWGESKINTTIKIVKEITFQEGYFYEVHGVGVNIPESAILPPMSPEEEVEEKAIYLVTKRYGVCCMCGDDFGETFFGKSVLLAHLNSVSDYEWERYGFQVWKNVEVLRKSTVITKSVTIK